MKWQVRLRDCDGIGARIDVFVNGAPRIGADGILEFRNQGQLSGAFSAGSWALAVPATDPAPALDPHSLPEVGETLPAGVTEADVEAGLAPDGGL